MEQVEIRLSGLIAVVDRTGGRLSAFLLSPPAKCGPIDLGAHQPLLTINVRHIDGTPTPQPSELVEIAGEQYAVWHLSSIVTIRGEVGESTYAAAMRDIGDCATALAKAVKIKPEFLKDDRTCPVAARIDLEKGQLWPDRLVMGAMCFKDHNGKQPNTKYLPTMLSETLKWTLKSEKPLLGLGGFTGDDPPQKGEIRLKGDATVNISNLPSALHDHDRKPGAQAEKERGLWHFAASYELADPTVACEDRPVPHSIEFRGGWPIKCPLARLAV